MSDLPLEGISVIDLSSGVGGAYCTKLLADYGADVLKVEPRDGDPVRRQPPFLSEVQPLESGALHLYLGTNKRSITLDVTTASGGTVLGQLLESADALVCDRPPGYLDTIGLNERVRRERFSRLVTTLITPFGQDGPYAHLPSTNLTSFAAGGQMSLTGDPDREPLKNGGEQADYQAGLNGFAATLAGLWAAQSSGVGDTIDISAQECQVSTLELALNARLYLGREGLGVRRGNVVSSILGIYPAADGHIGVHAMPRNFPALARLMDAEWMLEDDNFATSAARLQHDDELRALIYAWAADQKTHDVYQRAGETRAPVAFVHGMKDVLESGHLRARGYFHREHHPVAGELDYPGPPIRMGEGGWRSGRAPLLGEHTAEVLTALGYTPGDIDVFRGEGVI